MVLGSLTRSLYWEGEVVDQTRPRKAARLLAALARHPRDVRRYFTTSLTETDATLRLGLPWMSYGAIRYLDARLKPSDFVFEYGCGGSTIFFASRCRRVVTVESDPHWAEAIQRETRRLGLSNVEVVHAAAGDPSTAEFANSAFALATPDEQPDVVVIDSWDVEPPHPLRPVLFRRAEQFVRRPGGMIVLDDSWRYQAVRHDTSAATIHTEFGVGPARTTATMTDFYLYEK